MLEIDYLFDTNAVRRLIERLSPDEFKELADAWDKAGLRAAWTPDVIWELTGTNMNRKEGLTDEGLRASIIAARRFDQLARREILQSLPEVLWESLHDLAGVTPPLTGAPLEYAPRYRQLLDEFLELRSTDQIRIDQTPDGPTVSFSADRKTGFTMSVGSGFGPQAAERVEDWKGRIQWPEDLKDQISLVCEDLPKCALGTALKLGVQRELVEAALARPAEELFASPLFLYHAIERWYLLRRVIGEKRSIKRNDGVDLSLAAYMRHAERVVTDDANLSKLLTFMLEQGDQRVVSFTTLVTLVLPTSQS